MKNIVFLGGLFPKEIRKEIEGKSVGVIQYAADAFQWSLVEGLDNFYKELTIVNLPYVGSYPMRYKDIRMRTFSFSHSKEAVDINVGFWNLPVIKLFSRYYNCKRVLKNLLKDESVVIVYAIHTPFIKALTDLKKKYINLKICLVVPDLPQHMGRPNTLLYKVLTSMEDKILKKILKQVDAFVLLSDFMAKPLEVAERPWVRIEGIFSCPKFLEKIEKENYKTILYTGTLAKRYGILNLLDAFAKIKDPNYRLWICGDGDSKEELIKRIKGDSRIFYYGQVSREEALILQKKATVLVNPRVSEGEYTKFSFPSKTMEYIASKTPCVMHRLQGIPSEYYDLVFIAEKEDAEGLKNTIMAVCNKDQSELNEFGKRASQFILDNKNPTAQVRKIFNMINKL